MGYNVNDIMPTSCSVEISVQRYLSKANSMSSVRLIIVSWFCLLKSLHYGQCCGPAEIGQQYTITSTAIVTSDTRVVWQLANATILFDSSLSNPNVYPDLYIGTRTNLTILAVTKNDGTGAFQHLVDLVRKYTCALPVFKRGTLRCEHVALIINFIRTKCTTAQVYPKAKCQFILYSGSIDRRDFTDLKSHITYSHTDPQPGGNEYYSTSCTLRYPVDGFKPGIWVAIVKMYPDQTGVSLAQGVAGQLGNTQTLSVPTVNIDPTTCPKALAGEGDTNVRQGYIRQGQRASCLCTRDHAGNPTGKIGWSFTHGRNFTILSQNGITATIRIDSQDTFTCQSSSVLNGSHSMTYTPQYAYGPSSASLTFQRPGPIYLCPNQQTNIDITCQVPANSFNPTILFTIRDGNGNNLVTKVAEDTAGKNSVNYNFTKSGQHAFTCRVENAIFSDIFGEAPTKAIEVYEPPSDPPRISARSAQNGDILVEGDDVLVTCNVTGGYPPVQSVTVSCSKDLSLTNKGTSATLIINKVELRYSNKFCMCRATHVTGCYDLMGDLPLIIFSNNSTKARGNEEDTSPNSTAELAGIVIGSIVGMLVLAAVIVLIVFFIRRVELSLMFHVPVDTEGHLEDKKKRKPKGLCNWIKGRHKQEVPSSKQNTSITTRSLVTPQMTLNPIPMLTVILLVSRVSRSETLSHNRERFCFVVAFVCLLLFVINMVDSRHELLIIMINHLISNRFCRPWY